MDFDKSLETRINASRSFFATKTEEDLPTIITPPETPSTALSARKTETKKSTWNILYVLGVLGCTCILFHLFITTVEHHAIMDMGLRTLKSELDALMKLQLAHNNILNTSAIPGTETPRTVISGVQTGANYDHVPNAQKSPHDGSGYFSKEVHRMRKKHRTSQGGPAQNAEGRAMTKRGSGATFTWFHPGQGACGGFNGDNDFIVAISHLIWNNGAHCGDTITINYKGKSVQATVADECMSCDPNHIDLSPGLLHHIAGPGADMVSDGEWSFGNAPAPVTHEKPKPKPTATSTPPPEPTTTKAHTTTSSSAAPSTTSTKASSTTKDTSTSLASSTSAAATPSASTVVFGSDDGTTQNLEAFTHLFVNLASVAFASVFVEDS